MIIRAGARQTHARSALDGRLELIQCVSFAAVGRDACLGEPVIGRELLEESDGSLEEGYSLTNKCYPSLDLREYSEGYARPLQSDSR